MVSDTATIGWNANAWDVVARFGETDGSLGHAHVAYLLTPESDQRDLADAVHAICALHGRHPGLVDAALERLAQPAAATWLTDLAHGFARERGVIAQLAAAAGPLPSTPGQAQTDAALVSTRHALEMLARSDRSGCATGAAAALLVDWQAIRRVLGRAACRFGVEMPATLFPPAAASAAVVARLGDAAATERAIGFGAHQLLAQHRGLWDLLDARRSARATA